ATPSTSHGTPPSGATAALPPHPGMTAPPLDDDACAELWAADDDDADDDELDACPASGLGGQLVALCTSGWLPASPGCVTPDVDGGTAPRRQTPHGSPSSSPLV